VKRRLIVVLSTTAGVLVAIGVVGLLFAALYTPPPHDVHTPGAIAITNIHIERGDPRTTDAVLGLSPSLSLADIRCQAWYDIHRQGSCPDAAQLEQDLWPGITQTPNTLYVWLPNSCIGYYARFNLEYFQSNRRLVFHCYSAQSWIYSPPLQLPGVRALTSADLVLVPTNGIGQGDLAVIEDDRIEHPLGDDSTESPLGTVPIP
jgi:hypothetical protein